MDIFQALALGIVQGLGEFLPISSSGHLVLLRQIMGISGEYMFFDIMLHLGTALAIVVVFFREILCLFRPPFKKIALIFVSCLPAGIVGFFLSGYIEGFFSSAKYLCFFFALTAIFMLISEIVAKKSKKSHEITLRSSLMMGAMQAVAVFPGLSRSGSTILGGIICGCKRDEVAKFSFFMSIPVILGSVILSLTHLDSGNSVDFFVLAVGMVASFGSGLIAIKVMMRVIEKANFKWFALYLGALSITTFLVYFL